ncbi:MAG TPA: hypothetical protein VFG50_09190 [Rhodothermales bacterium]|nr:hypothetical protein [Rhodothermales bacterium]
MTTETIWIIVAAVVAVILIAVAIYAVTRRSRAHAHVGHKELHDSHEAMTREVAGLRDQVKLLADKVDRQDRSYTSLREEFLRGQQDLAGRLEGVGNLETTGRELQEQIFELREEHKVLMQRDERHERAVQDIQEEVNTVRSAVGTDGRRTIGSR